MNKRRIENFINNEVVFIKGQNLVNRNLLKIQNSNLKTGYFVVKVYDLDFDSNVNRWFIVNLKVTDNTVDFFECDCTEFKTINKPCLHIAASLLKIFENYWKEHGNEYIKEEWKSANLYFDEIYHENLYVYYKAFFECSLLNDEGKIIPIIIKPKMFNKKFDDNYEVLENQIINFVDKNQNGHKIKANLLKSIDIRIMEFLIDFSQNEIQQIKKDVNSSGFWINSLHINTLFDYLKRVYNCKNKNEVFKLINEKSQGFQALRIENYQIRAFLSKTKNNRYATNIQLLINDKWTNIAPIFVNSKKQIVLLNDQKKYFFNDYYKTDISLWDSSIIEWYLTTLNKGIKDFKIENKEKVVSNLFEFLPKMSVEIFFNLREYTFEQKIHFFYYNNGSPFTVLATDDSSIKGKNRLQLYERSIADKFEYNSPIRKIGYKSLRTKLKLKHLEEINDWYENFQQSDLATCKISKNLLIERKIIFNLNNLKKIEIQNGHLVIICEGINFSINEFAAICKEYNRGSEVYVTKDCYYNLKNPDNKDFFTFWSKFDFYNAKTPKPNVYEFPKFRAFDLLLAFDGNRKLLKKYVDDSVYELIKVFKDFHFEKMPITKPFDKILRPYQIEGQYWLRTLQHYGFGGILADDMGLGKTVQTISVIAQAYINTPNDISSLIVVPTSLLLNWESEFKKFAPDVKVTTIRGHAENRLRKISENKTGVEITSYSYFRRDIAAHKNKIYKFIIIDEAQNIKNHNSILAESIKSVQAEHRIALTGTPIENKLIELWSIFDFVIPGLFGSPRDFLKDYANPITKTNDKQIIERLKQKINTFVLRRTKDKVLSELPPKTETDIKIELAKEHRKIYDEKLKYAYKYVKTLVDKKQEKKNRFEILKLIIELRQICCSPLIKNPSFVGENTKFNACLDIIEESIANNKKILVFTQFLDMIKLFETELKKRKIGFFVLSGKTKKDQRMEAVKNFNSDKTPVFIASLKAGGVGLNLVGAEVVIHYDLWWNLAVQNQATDRVHRIGQTKSVQVYRVIVEDSIEERIIKIQEQKRQLSKNIINDDENILASLSFNDLVELFKPKN